MIRYLLLFIVFAQKLSAQEKTLDFYISQANKNAPQLREMHNQINSLGYDSSKLRASYGLQVPANANILYAPVVKGWGYDNAITNGQVMTGVVTVSKKVIGKNYLRARLNNFYIQK